MGETIKAIQNTLGLSAYIMGALVNINNIIGIMMGVVGFAYGAIKALEAFEVYRMKRIDRKRMENDYRKESK